MTDWKLTWRNK